MNSKLSTNNGQEYSWKPEIYAEATSNRIKYPTKPKLNMSPSQVPISQTLKVPTTIPTPHHMMGSMSEKKSVWQETAVSTHCGQNVLLVHILQKYVTM